VVIDMNETKLTTLAQVQASLEGTCAVEFRSFGDDSARYAHIPLRFAGLVNTFCAEHPNP
jgi:hypothetical protein